jgi:hypothetical protein
MPFRQQFGMIFFRISNWLSEHRGEMLWAILFGILFAGGAWFLAPPHPSPYKIYVIADRHTDRDTMKMFRAVERASHLTPLRLIDEVPVEVEVDQLADDREETILKQAQEISGRSDALLVIGHVPSQLTEASLPVFFGMRPQIPYIATVASDDNLLSRCAPHSACLKDEVFAPILQLSPTNEVQARSAVTFAILQGKRRFLIAFDNDPTNAAYTGNLVQWFNKAILAFNKKIIDTGGDRNDLAKIVGEYKMDQPPTKEALKHWGPDCVLYAGGLGEAQSLMTALAGARLSSMVILSDSAVQDGISPDDLKLFAVARFTNQIDAADYNNHRNLYAEDAFAIAGQLIDEVHNRGEDRRMRIRSLLHLQTVRDLRRNLDQVMERNSVSHSWYMGSSDEALYAFDGYKRFGGIFHVWVWDSKSSSGAKGEMLDVDHWHVPKGSLVTHVPRNETEAPIHATR